MVKGHTSVTVDASVLASARANRLNVSEILEQALRTKLSLDLEIKKQKDIPKEQIMKNTIDHLTLQLKECTKEKRKLHEDLETGLEKYEKLRRR